MLGINLGERKHFGPLPPQMRAGRGRWPLSMPLLGFSPADTWTLGHACMGTQIMGGTGSGKSSSSGRMIAKALLRSGAGGIVLCAKPGERAAWLNYAAQTGRSRSVIVFDGSGQHKFNFLDYELRRMDHFDAGNMVALFQRIMDAAGGRAAGAGGGDQEIWRNAVGELLSNCFFALRAAYGTLRLADLAQLIDSAPQSEKQAEDAAWQAGSFCHQTLVIMARAPALPISEADADVVARFFYQRWARRSDRTRSSIEMTFSAGARNFLTGIMRELFCTETTIIPELTHEGAIIILDFPVKVYHDAGTLAQHIFKYCWQRATETRRNISNDRTRPTFCFADECQFFISEYDAEFQSTARSSKACTVYITQGLSSLYSQVGGGNSKEIVDSLLTNFQTKIFHQNTNATTNEYASAIVGQQWLTITSHGTNSGTNSGSNTGTNKGWTSSFGGIGQGSNWGDSGGKNSGKSKGTSRGSSTTYNQQLANEVLPSTFNELRQGGPPEALIIQGGRVFRYGGRPYLRCSVPQQ